jgi:hypothetical protein
LAGVALLKKHEEHASKLLGASARLRAGPGLPPDALAEMVGTLRGWTAGVLDDRFDLERIEAELRGRLSPEVFEAAVAAGAAAEVHDVFLGEVDEPDDHVPHADPTDVGREQRSF